MSSRRPQASPAAAPAVWRKRNGVSLAAISASTKISVRYLEAIESGNFAALPGGAYGISYIRQYAAAIDFDADDLVEEFKKVTKLREPVDIDPPPPANWMTRMWGRLRAHLIAAPGGIPHPRD